MGKYSLAPHIHLCRTEDYVVLLDLRADKYLALDADSDDQLADLVEDWPARMAQPSGAEGRSIGQSSELERRMIAASVLVPSGKPGKPATPVTIDQPIETLAHSYFTEEHNVSVRHVARFFVACLYAAYRLRFGRIARTVECIQVERINGRSKSQHESMHEVPALVAVFEALRPFVLAGRNSCMFDSLALLKFLAMHGIHPQWVFGVRTLPFGAHCWVQSGDTVLNDTPDRVAIYTPIMTV